MKKIKLIIISLVLVIFLGPVLALAGAQYQEVNTSQGKVIIGLNRQEAYQKFGVPSSKGSDLWYYATPPGFFVNFSATSSILLYPDFYEATAGVPVEFKAFLSLPDAGVRDITKEVELVFDQPEYVKLAAVGVIIPKKAGDYSALAIYQEALSNPIHLKVKEAKENGQKEKEKLLSIDILPYRPSVTVEGVVDFVALGTFFDYDLNKYSVRDITQETAWSMRQRPNLAWDKQEGNRLYFLAQGQAEVLTKYQATESFLQCVEIKDKFNSGVKRLKHILVLPEVLMVLLDSNFNLRVFGTYYDNSVEELTHEVDWEISNPDVLDVHKDGFFLARSEGVTEITATKDGVEGLPVKVVVLNKSSHFLNAGSILDSSQKNSSERNALGEIQGDVDKLKKDFLVNKKELSTIRITPKLLEVGMGEEGELSATGVYSDDSLTDLTILGDWKTLDQGIATVYGGKVTCVAVGETSAYVEFKGLRSEYARITVSSARLVSLLLSPENLKIPRDGQAELKVLGNYYDHSQRDLTAQVSWRFEGSPTISINNGVARALKFGPSKVYAVHSHLKSNLASISVILTWGWLLWLLAKIALVLLLIILALVTVLYLLTENRKRRLRLLKEKPREFILGLHENATRLITIFGLRYDDYTFPLVYAELAKQKFMLKDNVFLNFSVRFEEAKYSHHVFQVSDVEAVVNDYNIFFERLCQNQGRWLTFYRHCLALLHCRPIFILPTPEVTA